MGNLNSSSTNASDLRPYQPGAASGGKNGLPVTISTEWMIDTGAAVSAITQGNANHFDLIPTGASASATTGGGGIIMKSGLTMHFDVFDSVTGSNRTMSCSLDVGVKPNNHGSEILGMDQLAHVSAIVRWDASVKDGDLYQ